MQLYGPDVDHLAGRCVAPAAPNKVCLAVSVACPAHAGAIFPSQIYIKRLNVAIILHQVHLSKS